MGPYELLQKIVETMDQLQIDYLTAGSCVSGLKPGPTCDLRGGLFMRLGAAQVHEECSENGPEASECDGSSALSRALNCVLNPTQPKAQTSDSLCIFKFSVLIAVFAMALNET